jgi:hypothetical protein
MTVFPSAVTPEISAAVAAAGSTPFGTFWKTGYVAVRENADVPTTASESVAASAGDAAKHPISIVAPTTIAAPRTGVKCRMSAPMLEEKVCVRGNQEVRNGVRNQTSGRAEPGGDREVDTRWPAGNRSMNEGPAGRGRRCAPDTGAGLGDARWWGHEPAILD